MSLRVAGSCGGILFLGLSASLAGNRSSPFVLVSLEERESFPCLTSDISEGQHNEITVLECIYFNLQSRDNSLACSSKTDSVLVLMLLCVKV